MMMQRANRTKKGFKVHKKCKADSEKRERARALRINRISIGFTCCLVQQDHEPHRSIPSCVIVTILMHILVFHKTTNNDNLFEWSEFIFFYTLLLLNVVLLFCKRSPSRDSPTSFYTIPSVVVARNKSNSIHVF